MGEQGYSACNKGAVQQRPPKQYNALKKAGLKNQMPQYFLAPYEWYNRAISRWTEETGMTLINFTPGTGTNADYTTPDMANYRSSDFLVERLASFEESAAGGAERCDGADPSGN